MKRLSTLLIAGVLWATLGGLAHASWDDGYWDYDDSESHILRIAAYVLNPFGVALEYGIMRPLHLLVSAPGADIVFGHHPHTEDSAY